MIFLTDGRCVFCGTLIDESTTSDGETVAHCMYIDNIELRPSQFSQVSTFKGLWLCHNCFSSMLQNIAINNRDFNIGP